eukprot:SAG31_NODE_4472_length_3204_cov_7.250242_2_plen_150_part_00
MPVHELYSSSVYTRIRPVSDGESDGHGSGEAVDKSLAGFEDGAMLIGSKNGEIERFEFPKAIFGPETTQEELFDRVAPELLQGFLAGENDALIFAYGQTGTGKVPLAYTIMFARIATVPYAVHAVFSTACSPSPTTSCSVVDSYHVRPV